MGLAIHQKRVQVIPSLGIWVLPGCDLSSVFLLGCLASWYNVSYFLLTTVCPTFIGGIGQ